MGRAVTVPVLLGGQEVGAGRLLARSSAFLVLSWQLPECPRDPHSGCCSYRAACRGAESSFGALGGSPWLCLQCTRCPGRGCVLGTEQALCGDGQQRRASCVCCLVCSLARAGRGLVGAGGGCNCCGRLKRAFVGCWVEVWQSSDSRDTFLRPELRSPARSESMQ